MKPADSAPTLPCAPAAQPPSASGAPGWRFPATFWFANTAELFERAAFYGMFVTLGLHLSRSIGFSDVHAGIISGFFSFLLYFLPPFMGALADRIGFRRALIFAFALLTAGYVALAFV